MLVSPRRITFCGIFVVVLMAGFLLTRHFSGAASSARGNFLVKKVSDGDTVVLEGCGVYFKARLAGIDAPEFGWKNIPDQPYAGRSRDYLSSLIQSREVVVKQVAIDDFNRPIVFIRCEDVDINLQMVEKGLAETYRGKTEFSVEAFYRAEERARSDRLNIWSLENYVSPRKWRRLHRHR